jgi:hypothetical protein
MILVAAVHLQPHVMPEPSPYQERAPDPADVVSCQEKKSETVALT